MKPYNNSNSAGEVLKPLAARFGLVTIMLGVGLALSTPANAVSPPANSVIGNQAIANYNDASGAPQTTLSNLVQTTVLPVGAFTLTPNVTKDIIAGQTAYLPHTLTNNGNTADTFNLAFANNAAGTNTGGNPSAISVYNDVNSDGVPDDLATPICTINPATYAVASGTCTTPSVPGSGATFNFVVAVQSPTGVTGAPWEAYDLTGTGVTAANYTTVSQTVNDRVNIATGALFDVTKSINVPGGPASTAACVDPTFAAAGCYKATYTLKYTNNGQATGTLYIKDVIGSGATAGMKYIPNSATWSNGSMGASPDAAIVAGTADAGPDGSGSRIFFQFTSGTGTVDAYITGVPQNVSGTISFSVGILNTAQKGTSTTTNTANFATTVEIPTPTPTTTPNNPTNPSPYTVGLGQVFATVANNNTGSSTDNAPDTANAGVNQVLQPTAVAGDVVTFNNVIWNTGDGTDTFDIALCTNATVNANCIAASTFPAGTAFQLYKSDGLNPLLDSTGNGTPDTGPIPATGSYTVVVKATIPLNACASGTCPAGPFAIQKIATSAGDTAKFNNVFDQLTAITAPTVDLKNVDAGAANPNTITDAAVANTPTTTNATAPGATTFFDLYVYNTTSVADSYELNYSVVNPAGGAVPASVANTLPAGWSVQFRTNPTGVTCTSNVGAAVTATDLINGVTAGPVFSKQRLCAMVTSPASAASGNYDVFFKATSRTSGISDTKLDRVTLTQASNGLTFTPNNQGQIYPGGTVVYNHVLNKTGTDNCTGVTVTATMDAALVTQGWSALVYNDVDGNRVYTAGTDTLVTSANAAAGAVPNLTGTVVNVLVQVFAPNGAAIGATDLVTLTADATCGTVVSKGIATDLTTVINGQLRLLKSQAFDAACDGTPDTAYGTDLITAKPNQCIRYKVTATNEGVAPVSAVVIRDITPAFTTYDSSVVAGACGAGGTITEPANGATGDVLCTYAGTLAPGGQDVLTFGVRINP